MDHQTQHPQRAAKSLTQTQHLAEFVLERLAEGLARADACEGELHHITYAVALKQALQRLMGAMAGDAAEARLVALLQLPHDYLIGQQALAIAHGRALVAADLAAARAGQPATHTLPLPSVDDGRAMEDTMNFRGVPA